MRLINLNDIVKVLKALEDIFFPPSCAGCGALVGAGILCQECRDTIERVQSPRCPRCATAFDGSGSDHLCGRCITHPPPFESTDAPFVYGGPIAEGLRALKYGPSPERIAPFAQMWAEAAGPLPPSDLAVPVPLHPKRLRQRGFNQSMLLAKALLKGRGVRLDPFVLYRLRYDPPQARMEGAQRRRAPFGAFAVPQNKARRIQGLRVILCDDVMTTGATARACARALKKAGAAEVHLAVLARA